MLINVLFYAIFIILSLFIGIISLAVYRVIRGKDAGGIKEKIEMPEKVLAVLKHKNNKKEVIE